MIMIIVFFVILQNNLQTQYKNIELQIQIWKHNIIFIMFLILIIFKTAVLREFHIYLQKLIKKEILTHLIFDKYYMLLINVKWCEILSKMRWVNKLKTHYILLNNILSKMKKYDLFENLNLNQIVCQII